MKSSLLLSMFLWLTCISCDDNRKSLESNHAHEVLITEIMKTYLDSCWNMGDIEKLKNITTVNFTRNLNGIPVAMNQSEMQAHMKIAFTGFPDLKVSVDSTFVKSNTIFTHWTATGTHTGRFGEMMPTGKKMKVSGLSQLYFNTEGNLAQESVVYNELNLLQQLGYTLNSPVLK